MRSVSETRASIKDVLVEAYPDITWFDGRLRDDMYDSTQTLGAISTISDVQAANDFFLSRTIALQIALPITLIGDNMGLDQIDDPSAIEDLAAGMINTLESHGNIPDGSWYYRFIRMDYPSDPNGQQTRANIQLLAYEGSQW